MGGLDCRDFAVMGPGLGFRGLGCESCLLPTRDTEGFLCSDSKKCANLRSEVMSPSG